jgi:predicted PurR-regulated permease PerM
MTESRKWLIVFSVSGIGLLLYLLAPVLTPFLISALFAYMGDPLVDRLEALKFPRALAVVTVFLVIFLIVILLPIFLIPLLEQQISALLARLPSYISWIQKTILPSVTHTLGIEEPALELKNLQQILVQHWRQAGGIAAAVLSSASRSGLAMLAWIANLILIPVVTFYLLRDWDILVTRVRELMPRKVEPVVVLLAKNSDEVLGAFLRGQVMVMLALGTIYSIGLWLVGLDFGLLIGMLAGLVSFVPYLGFIVGILLAGVAAFMQFQEVLPLLWVALVFGVGQVLEGTILTPLLVGDKIGLHPVAVIFAVLAGGQLFGFFGVLLALPVAAVVMVMLRYAHEQYVGSQIYSE